MSRDVDSWNSEYPIGTPVTYHPIRREDGEFDGVPEHTKTRSAAWALGSGHVVVKIDGRAGGVHVSHIQVRPPERPSCKRPPERCPSCKRPLWSLLTKTWRPEEMAARDPALLHVVWDVCEQGCCVDPPECGDILGEDARSVSLGIDEFGDSRAEADKQTDALPRAKWLKRFRDRSLVLFATTGDHKHIRRARRIESSRRSWLLERVRPTEDHDSIEIGMTLAEQLGWDEVRLYWHRGSVVVGGGARGPAQQSTSPYKADHIVEALRAHDKSRLPVAVGHDFLGPKQGQRSPGGGAEGGPSSRRPGLVEDSI